MEKLPTKKLYSLAGFLVIALLGIGFGLHAFERSLRPDQGNGKHEIAPAVSPLQEVEFESGALARDLHAQQLKELNSYSKMNDAFVGVPIERAFAQMLKETK